MQEKIYGENFTEVTETKAKVKNLWFLPNPMKVTGKTVIIESLKQFNRFILITD